MYFYLLGVNKGPSITQKQLDEFMSEYIGKELDFVIDRSYFGKQIQMVTGNHFAGYIYSGDKMLNAELIKSGLELLTENGFISSGIDTIVKNVSVPKGSFYYYFKSKEDFGYAVLSAYGGYFAHKLDKHLTNCAFSPLNRLENFVNDAKAGMAKYQFKRGCLVGNLMQESPQLSEALTAHLQSILREWQQRVSRCLSEAKISNQIAENADNDKLASLFWSGWEGAVMRAKLYKSTEPLDEFWNYFSGSIKK